MKNYFTTKFIFKLLLYFIIIATTIVAENNDTQLSEKKILEILIKTKIPKLQLKIFTFIDIIQKIEKLSAKYTSDGKGIKINCSSNVLYNYDNKIDAHVMDCDSYYALFHLCELNGHSYKIQDDEIYIYSEVDKNIEVEKNGILITDEVCKQIFSPYLSGKIPLFITSDSLIGAYHVLYEESILCLENTMASKFPEILSSLLNDFNVIYKNVKGNPKLVSAAKKRANIVVGVALRLMDNSFKFDDKELNEIINEEVKKIKEAKIVVKPKWLGNPEKDFLALDYSRYKPRGFYSKTEKMKNYFRAVSWLQSIPFRVSNDEELLTILMLGNPIKQKMLDNNKNKNEYERFFNAYKLFIGNKNDWDLMKAAKETDMILNSNFLVKKRKKLENEAQIQGGISKINDQIRFPPEESNRVAELNFRILSAYQTPSAILFQQTTDRRSFQRSFPEGLEICVALGSKFAEEKIESSEKEKLLIVIEKNKKCFDGNSLYFSYLNALEALLEVPETNAPAFMKNDAWKAKSCNTVLASWAHLRYTWSLQANQTADYFGMFQKPEGFVEPNPKFWGRMTKLVSETWKKLEYAGAFEERYKLNIQMLWYKLEDVCQKLETIAYKQLQKTEFNENEIKFIKKYGESIAEIMLYGGNSYLNPRDDAPRIVDIFSNHEQGGYLHVGISRPRKIYVLYPWKGKLIFCVGAVLPYYEFVNGTRLTDSEWKEKLDSNKRPPILKWQKSIIKGGNLTRPDLKNLLE